MERDKAPFLGSVVLCFNPNFYPAVLRQSTWRSLLYLGLICAAVYGVVGYRFAALTFDRQQESFASHYKAALPDFHFENGEADYPPDKPHIYQEREGNKVFAVIVDTSGETKELGKKYEAGILITKTEIVTKALRGTEKRQPIPKTAEKVAAKEFFIGLARKQKPRAVATLTSHVYISQLIAKVILVAVVSGVLLFGDKGRRQEYPFGYYFNVGCYAVTPFVLSALARGEVSGRVVSWVSYGVSLMLFLALAATGLGKCRQQDARQQQLAKAQGDVPRGNAGRG